MKLKNKKIAFGLTNCIYAFKPTINEIKKIVSEGGEVLPIISEKTYKSNSKFETFSELINKIEGITKRQIMIDIAEVENIEADTMVIAPCSRKQHCKIIIFYI